MAKMAKISADEFSLCVGKLCQPKSCNTLAIKYFVIYLHVPEQFVKNLSLLSVGRHSDLNTYSSATKDSKNPYCHLEENLCKFTSVL